MVIMSSYNIFDRHYCGRIKIDQVVFEQNANYAAIWRISTILWHFQSHYLSSMIEIFFLFIYLNCFWRFEISLIALVPTYCLKMVSVVCGWFFFIVWMNKLFLFSQNLPEQTLINYNWYTFGMCVLLLSNWELRREFNDIRWIFPEHEQWT